MSRDDALSVLIVEDELLIALDIEDLVASLGWAPLGPATTVETALSLIERTPPQAALLDETLHGKSVLPVAHALADRGIPFVIVSGNLRSPSRDERLQRAPRLSKPVSYSRLKAELERMMPT